MSLEEQAPTTNTNGWGAFIPTLEELSNAPPESAETAASDENEAEQPRRARIRHRGERQKLTSLQQRYLSQIRQRQNGNPDLVTDMSRFVAWTWLPGKDRWECPPLVEFRDPRLVVLDYYPMTPDGPPTHIGLTMFCNTFKRDGRVCYAGPDNIAMYKDFSLLPRVKAGGLALDSNNEIVFRTALELDYHIEMAARELIPTEDNFDPPPPLIGFPQHYVPVPEWKAPMQQAVMRAFHPSAPTLKCLMCPGGLISDIVEANDGFRVIHITNNGITTQVRVPTWVTLMPTTRKNMVVPAGTPLADLPRQEFAALRDITGRYTFKSLEWLEQRIMDEMTELCAVAEEVYNKDTKQRDVKTVTWRCVPARFVQTQLNRSTRYYLDFRRHLGRRCCSTDNCGSDVMTEDQHLPKIHVMKFPKRPTVSDLVFSDGGSNEKLVTWYADMMTHKQDVPWAGRVGCRGERAVVVPPDVPVPATI